MACAPAGQEGRTTGGRSSNLSWKSESGMGQDMWCRAVFNVYEHELDPCHTLEMDYSGDVDDGADIWMWVCTCIWYLYLILIFVPDIDMCTWYWYLSMILIFVSDIYAFIWYLYLYLIVVPLSVHLYHYMKFAPVSDIENLNRGMVSVVRYHIDIVTPDQKNLWWAVIDT